MMGMIINLVCCCSIYVFIYFARAKGETNKQTNTKKTNKQRKILLLQGNKSKGRPNKCVQKKINQACFFMPPKININNNNNNGAALLGVCVMLI